MIKHTAKEKEAHLLQILYTKEWSASKIQKMLSGSEWSMRRQTIQKISKEHREAAPIRTIKKSKMLPSTKKKLIKMVKQNHKKGEQWKTADMMRNIFNPDTLQQKYYHCVLSDSENKAYS
jgi:hypothetical protein